MIKHSNGTNVYAVIRAPRSDGSESLLLMAPLQSTSTGEPNSYGIAIILALARTILSKRYQFCFLIAHRNFVLGKGSYTCV